MYWFLIRSISANQARCLATPDLWDSIRHSKSVSVVSYVWRGLSYQVASANRASSISVIRLSNNSVKYFGVRTSARKKYFEILSANNLNLRGILRSRATADITSKNCCDRWRPRAERDRVGLPESPCFGHGLWVRASCFLCDCCRANWWGYPGYRRRRLPVCNRWDWPGAAWAWGSTTIGFDTDHLAVDIQVTQVALRELIETYPEGTYIPIGRKNLVRTTWSLWITIDVRFAEESLWSCVRVVEKPVISVDIDVSSIFRVGTDSPWQIADRG